MKRHIAAALLLFMVCCGTAGVFGLMWFQGTVKLTEDVIWIRAVELGFSIAAGAYALWVLLTSI